MSSNDFEGVLVEKNQFVRSQPSSVSVEHVRARELCACEPIEDQSEVREGPASIDARESSRKSTPN
jgi:hypothetical protein